MTGMQQTKPANNDDAVLEIRSHFGQIIMAQSSSRLQSRFQRIVLSIATILEKESFEILFAMDIIGENESSSSHIEVCCKHS